MLSADNASQGLREMQDTHSAQGVVLAGSKNTVFTSKETIYQSFTNPEKPL